MPLRLLVLVSPPKRLLERIVARHSALPPEALGPLRDDALLFRACRGNRSAVNGAMDEAGPAAGTR
jgi:hypothetical protein